MLLEMDHCYRSEIFLLDSANLFFCATRGFYSGPPKFHDVVYSSSVSCPLAVSI